MNASNKLYLAGIFIFSFLVYGHYLGNAPSYDDLIWFGEDSRIAELTFLELFTTGTFPGNLYRPVALASFKLNQILFADNFSLWRLTNILLHACNALLIFRLFAMNIRREVAFFAALLFSAHPMATEVVMSVANRTESLSLFFTLLALNYNKSFTIVFLASFLAFLSKESSYYLIGLLILLSFHDRAFIKSLLAAVLATIASISLRIFVLGGLTPEGFVIMPIDNVLVLKSTLERIVPSFYIVCSYFKNFLFPVNLSPDYTFASFIPPLKPWESKFVFSCLAIFVSLIFFFKTRSRDKQLGPLYIFIWSLLTLGIASNLLLPIGTIFSDRLFYSGLAPTSALFSLLILKYVTPIASYLLTLSVIFCALISFQYSNYWDGGEKLFAYTVKIVPESYRANLSYGHFLCEAENYEPCILYLKKAQEIFPNSQEVGFLIAQTYKIMGNEVAYKSSLKELLINHPKHGPGLLALGKLAIKNQNIQEAIRILELASTRESVSEEAKQILDQFRQSKLDTSFKFKN